MSLNEYFKERPQRKRGLQMQEGKNVEGVLGIPDVPQDENVGYLPFRQAVRLAKEHQPDLFERSRAVRALRMEVASLCTDIDEPVKFYTAVGTPLDIYHGIDAFFQQGEHMASVDISMRHKESYKADVLLIAMLDAEGAIVIADDEMERAAHAIADRLNVLH